MILTFGLRTRKISNYAVLKLSTWEDYKILFVILYWSQSVGSPCWAKTRWGFKKTGLGEWWRMNGVWLYCMCAAKAIFYCPSMNSHRPRSQNTAKERTLIPEKDSTRKRPRSHVSLEKSSKNYKPLKKWAKPNLLPDVTPQPANFSGDYFRRVCHVVESKPPEFLAVISCQINWPKEGRGRGESRFDLAH